MGQIVKLRRSSVSGQKPTNSHLQLGEIALNTTDGKAFLAVSGSLGESVQEFITTNTSNTGSINLSGSINLIGNQIITGSLTTTGGLIGDLDFDYITNTPTLVSGSSQIEITGTTGFSDYSSSVANMTSSHSVSSSYTMTASFALNAASGGIPTIENDYHGRVLAVSSSDAIWKTGIVSSSEQIEITGTTGFNDFSSSIASMSVMSSSYAATASVALMSLDSKVYDGAYSVLDQSTPSSEWTFNHNIGQRYPIFQIYDTTGKVIMPSEITTVDAHQAIITFPGNVAGRAIASLGVGPGGLTQAFVSSSIWSLEHSLGTDYPLVNIWDDNRNVILPDRIESVDENNINVYFSVPKSGYLNVAKGGHIIDSPSLSDPIISGSLTIDQTSSIGAKCITLTGSAQIFDLGTFDGANFDYVVKDGLNMRAGMVLSVWNGVSSSYNEVSTTDLGDTNGISFTVNGSGQLNAVITTGSWTIETLYRALGCGI